jgi:hypothetical protein
MSEYDKPRMFWWIRQIFLVLVGCFFVLFGVHILILSYQLKDPFSFVMTFFSSNLIILISATLVIGFVIRMKKAYSNPEMKKNDHVQ